MTFAQDVTTNLLGTFTFNSLADLDGGPSGVVHARSSSPRERSQAQFIGGVSLGDSYRPTDDLQIQYGLRVDGNRFTTRRRSTPTSSGCSARATTTCRTRYYRQPARRLLVDARHGGADRGVRGRRARTARGGPRRHRRVPEHAERAARSAPRSTTPGCRAACSSSCASGAAAPSRTGRRTRRTSARFRSRAPTARRHGVRERARRTSRCSTPNYQSPRSAALEPAVERRRSSTTASATNVDAHVLAQPESAAARST